MGRNAALLIMACLLLGACQPRIVVQTVEVTRQVEVTRLVEVEKAPPTFSTPHPILADVRVRRALAYCTDKLALVQAAYPRLPKQAQGQLVMDTFIPKDHWAYAGDEAISLYPYAPSQGMALLQAAGWQLAKGKTYRTNEQGEELVLKLTTITPPSPPSWEAVWEQQMKQCGVRIVRLHVPAAWWFGDGVGLARRDFELGAFTWVGQADPGGQSLWACDQVPTPGNGWAGQNYTGWCNEAASQAIYQANNSLLKQERVLAYTLVQQAYTQDVPSLPLFNHAEIFAYDLGLAGFAPQPGQAYYTADAAQWHIAGQDSLVIGLTQEPRSLFGLAEHNWATHLILALVNDVYATSARYDYQPRLQEALSTIENGLAFNNDVIVKEGELVYDARGKVVKLEPGVVVKDASGAEVEFTAGPLSMKQLVVRYVFRDDLRWSDGQPVTQADYELTYKINCDRESGAISFAACDRAQQVEFATDGYTVTWRPGVQQAAYAVAPYLSSARSDGLLPAQRRLADGRRLADVPAGEWAGLSEVSQAPLGVGPYVLKEWIQGKRMVFEANPYYYGGASKTRTIVVVFLSPEEAEAQLLDGQIDLLGPESLPGISPELAAAVQRGQLKLTVVADESWEHIDFNLFVR